MNNSATNFNQQLEQIKKDARVFARLYPQLAPTLLGAATEPDIQRLIEAFAFITSKLNKKLELEFPEFIETLVKQIYPHYLKPAPSMTIMQLSLKDKDIKLNDSIIDKGELLVQQLDKKNYFFNICYQVNFVYWQIENISYDNNLLSLIIISQREQNSINELVFYLGEKNKDLFLFLTNYLLNITLEFDKNKIELPLSNLDVLTDNILPHANNINIAQIRLFELLNYPSGYLFIKLKGLKQFTKNTFFTNGASFKITFTFKKTVPVLLDFAKFKLNCVPAVNLFPDKLEPLYIDGKKEQYCLDIKYQNKALYLWKIDNVLGNFTNGNKTRKYNCFEDFKAITQDYSYSLKTNCNFLNKKIDYNLRFRRKDDFSNLAHGEIVSIDATVMQSLLDNYNKEQNYTFLNTNLQSFKIHNITGISKVLIPDLNPKYMWKLLANIKNNDLTVEQLRSILSILFLPTDKAFKYQFDNYLLAIKQIEVKPCEKLLNRQIVLGTNIYLYLDPSVFSGEGEFFWFGYILANFYVSSASVNSFNNLLVINIKTDALYDYAFLQKETICN